ncbi:medium-chain acyl-CoA ligase ACSF2, mitochondrial-like [Tigriopus californicus]|uniref:medium-chain acyl-CoA ligase ACSF2, mitochondrial-like n=1 Tax=Tigriopus californicus TaxID=6832 RepID=UPI0027DA7F4F|nr:medium-chain acyl-CoA ligase ACSF2, mitochondrial-like [Tigriopus californicus]
MSDMYKSAVEGSLQRNLSTVLPSGNNSDIKWSYVCGTTSEPLTCKHVGQLFDEKTTEFASRTCIVSIYQDISKTFAEVRKEVDRLAAGFISLGMDKGDRLGIWGITCYEWYLVQFAAAKAGLVLVNINPAYQAAELKYCLNLVDVKGLVCSETFRTQNYYKILNAVAPEVEGSKPGSIKSANAPALEKLVMISDKEFGGAFRFQDVMKMGDSKEYMDKLESLQNKIQMDDACNIQFTSGTTGSPKGACSSHHNVVNNTRIMGQRIQFDKKPHAICLACPFYHSFGCIMGNICALTFGVKIVVPAAHFNGKSCLEAIEKEKCTAIYGSPTMFVDMLNLQRQHAYDVSSVETGIMAGASCPTELCKNVGKELNMTRFTVVYGMTETGPVTFQAFPGASTTLYVNPHVEAKVCDENGKLLPCGTPGEICTRGYSTMLGYWGDEKKTKDTIDSKSWLHSGDLGVIHENGSLEIVGRIKDMIIRGGENLFPKEIEELLHQHPKVMEASVVGIPDERMGEELCAWIRLEDNTHCTEEELKAYFKGKIAHFKIPRFIIFVDKFPLTVTGKIQKFKVIEESIKKLGR